ncbi:hypothetical protein KGA66_20245 [Actinocrinis puniceicyclus]|uniref:DUF6398 domain-containing protein n=1 Tax=Actinocrinis puniceicyclus TaxID=977794 RepID=A0A8J8BDL5_9ACTN|nr:hypothetical protein [Actinocrinis puniceicyclus]
MDVEYAQLCRVLAAVLGRKRPSPLLRGDRRIWAAGIVHAIGWVNFLADPAHHPHLRTDRLAELVGVRFSRSWFSRSWCGPESSPMQSRRRSGECAPRDVAGTAAGGGALAADH